MTSSTMIQNIIEVICRNQILSSEDLLAIEKRCEDLPERMYPGFYIGHLITNQDKTDWKALLEGIEQLLENSNNDEEKDVIYDYILETFVNSMSHSRLKQDHLEPYIGPLSRKYMAAYSSFIDSIPSQYNVPKSKK